MGYLFRMTVKLLVSLLLLLQAQLAWSIESDVFQRAEQFHGDNCTGLLIGVRLGVAAKQALQDAGAKGKLKARYFNHACPVDGIQVVVGTTLGTKAIEVVDKKENRLILSDKTGTHQVEALLTKVAEEKSRRSLDLKKKMEKLPAESQKWRQIKAEADKLQEWFRNAPDGEVVVVRGGRSLER